MFKMSSTVGHNINYERQRDAFQDRKKELEVRIKSHRQETDEIKRKIDAERPRLEGAEICPFCDCQGLFPLQEGTNYYGCYYGCFYCNIITDLTKKEDSDYVVF